MKALSSFTKPLSSALVLLACIAASPAQAAWETVDSVINAPDEFQSFVGIDASADGDIYAVDLVSHPSGLPGTTWLRRSADQGSSWQNVAESAGTLNNLAVDGMGNVYLAGNIDGKWTVWRSESQGVSWSVLDSYALPGGRPTDIAVDPTGTIWVVGSYDNPTYSHRIWVVRRGTPNPATPGGILWVDVDPFSSYTKGLVKPDFIIDARPQAVAVRAVPGGSPEIYVGGSAFTQRNPDLWVVRRSKDAGASWTTVDQWDCQDRGVGLMDLAVSPIDGAVYAVGRIYETLSRKTGQFVGLVRKGVPTTSGGITWANVDRVIASTAPLFMGVTVAGDGRVFVAGGANGWLVRTSIDGVAPFTTTDASASGVPFAVSVDPSGNVFVVGRDDSDANSGAIIRRLPASVQ